MAESISAAQRATLHLALSDAPRVAVKAAVTRNDLSTLMRLLENPQVTSKCLAPDDPRPSSNALGSHVKTITDLYDFGAHPGKLCDIPEPDQSTLHVALGGLVASGLLHQAAAGRPACLALLLEAGKGQQGWQAHLQGAGKGGLTPLHVACCAHASHQLLSAGAAVDPVSCTGSTPLMRAAQYGRAGSALVLLLHGADLQKRSRGVHVCFPERDVFAFCGPSSQIQAPRVWLPNHPPTALQGGRARCRRKLRAHARSAASRACACVQAY